MQKRCKSFIAALIAAFILFYFLTMQCVYRPSVWEVSVCLWPPPGVVCRCLFCEESSWHPVCLHQLDLTRTRVLRTVPVAGAFILLKFARRQSHAHIHAPIHIHFHTSIC